MLGFNMLKSSMQKYIKDETSSLDRRLRLEGWSLHQRISWISNQRLQLENLLPESDKLQAWRQVVAPDNSANFEQRLAWDGIKYEHACWALQPDLEDCPFYPPWWPILASLRQAATDGFAPQRLAERCVREPFVHAWRPAAAWALQTLQVRCSDLLPLLQLSDDAWLDLGEALVERLCNTADHALWEQFNQRRTPGQILLAHLGANGDGSGGPVHNAYDVFISELLKSGYKELLSEFPVLGRLLATISELWLEASSEMLHRLAVSRLELQEQFGIASDALLIKVQLGLSDPHRGARAVAILSFGDAQAKNLTKVVYKPKDMRLDQTYQNFLQKLNDSCAMPPLRCLTVLCKGDYGFMEWVEHSPCTNDEDLARFYTNAGRVMAVLHLLGCNDCHFENLIASNNHLILIDTETLLNVSERDLISSGDDDPDSLSLMQSSIEDSVLRSGLLPKWLMVGAGRKHVFDISALGIQPTPERDLPGWMAVNSDGMMAGTFRQACELPSSLPVALDSPQRLTDFIEQLCGGFTKQMQDIIHQRIILLAVLPEFSNLPRRLLARSTRIYYAIQRQMLKPVSLRSAVSQGLNLEQLSRSFVLLNKKPNSWPIFQAELLQMERLDIPLFEHLTDSEELPLPEELAPIQGYWLASGLESARRRLLELDSSQIEFQEKLIRGAIAAKNLNANYSPFELNFRARANNHQHGKLLDKSCVKTTKYGEEAFRLGEELWNSAIFDRKGRPEWLGMDVGVDGESFNFGLIGNSLYSGTSGIGLLFERLALSSPDPAAASMWHERAWSCFARLAQLAENNNMDQFFRLIRDLPYGLNGSGGILLALLLLAQSGVSEAASLAEQLVEQLRPERLQADKGVDLLSGVTGLIGPLLILGTKQGLQLAIVCGERLLNLQLESGGWSLGTSLTSQRRPALTGFSHGAAGMAAAFARLAQATGQQRFAAAARRAVGYERDVFVADKGNWPDFRRSSEPNEFMLSWCHGAPGILLCRQVLQAAGLADDQTDSELNIARTITMSALKQTRLSEKDATVNLCCGVFGLTSLLRVDNQINGGLIDAAVPEAEARVVSQAKTDGSYKFFSVENGSLNLPGLLTGKAGVAFALIEATDDQHWMPQVLSAGLLGQR